MPEPATGPPSISDDDDWPTVCTCSDGSRDGVLVDWVRGTVTHPYTDCPRRQYTDRQVGRG